MILNKHWIIDPKIPAEVDQELANYPAILRQIIYNRGHRTQDAARRYIEALPPEGAEPLALSGVEEAAKLIQHAIKNKKPIAVYGDYDVDGVTATALLTQALESLGAKVKGYIPNRFDEGYGLNTEALSALYDEGIRLVITVDCGIRSPEEVEHAQRLGLDVIITDHHQPGAELPPARAIINPKQPNDKYPEKDLAGVGLAYKLASGLMMLSDTGDLEGKRLPPITNYLDLVALGTVADVAPLVGENRSLVRQGLEYIRRPHRQGLMSLIGVTNLQTRRIAAEHIGFVLGPRLNAAGRLDSAMAALKLLTTSDVREAAYLAQTLDDQNRDRQKITRETQEQAEKLALQAGDDPLLLFAAHEAFNPGVVGLAAARLTEKYYRPAIVANIGDEFTRASCRSIPEFHITDALDQCAALFEQHGGHAAAAGFTVRNERVGELIEQLNAITYQKLADQDLHPKLKADMEIPLSDLRPELLPELSWLEPTGHKNPQAAFVTRGLKVKYSRAVGKDNTHLKLTVTDGRITYDAIAFRQGHWQDEMPALVDLLYTFELNEYNGRSNLQLNVRDLKASR